MLTEKYEINSSTCALIPNSDFSTRIIETYNIINVPYSVSNIIDYSCAYYGSSFKGRLCGSKNALGSKYKLPIIIEESREMIFFPTTSYESDTCAWISLKNISISDILRTYNGGEYNLENLKKFRKLPINLFNVGAFYEAKSKNAIPCVISEKSDSMQKQLQTVRFVVDAGLYDSSKYQILKKLTPTVEFRITPSTTDLGYFQQNLLLFSDLFLMAQNLERIQGLKQKVDTRNKLIDEKGPSVFEKGIDEGISDITHFLQPELRDRLQMQYMFAEQVPLYSNSINR